MSRNVSLCFKTPIWVLVVVDINVFQNNITREELELIDIELLFLGSHR